ncbi:MAG TPA: Na/Pi symporter [Acidobacteriota bacterium]|nr:Na/Pi symporter [Acidobacteriota bacterium]
MSEKQTVVLRVLTLGAILYIFFVALDLMGVAFKSFGREFAESLMEGTDNPFVGLFIGILATTLIQSSSTTTSMTVAIVAENGLTIEGAIPIIMGANIGTSVTNTLVSLAHVTRPEEFRRAFAAATIHDFFNWMTVLVLFPIEYQFHFLARTAQFLEKVLEGSGGLKLFNPLKAVVEPVAEGIHGIFDSGILTLVLALLGLFFALRGLVRMLRQLLSDKAEEILHKTLFRSAWHGLAAGTVITVMVQSSSVTTSTVVPLVGAGVLTLAQIFPFTLGANIGTTVTPILAGLSLGNPAAVTVGLSHLMFNITGGLIIFPFQPLRRIPIFLATKMGELGARSRTLAGAYILTVFFGIPLLLLFLFGDFSPAASEQPPPAPPAQEAPAPQQQ